jgi:hypothetical protein
MYPGDRPPQRGKLGSHDDGAQGAATTCPALVPRRGHDSIMAATAPFVAEVAPRTGIGRWARTTGIWRGTGSVSPAALRLRSFRWVDAGWQTACRA